MRHWCLPRSGCRASGQIGYVGSTFGLALGLGSAIILAISSGGSCTPVQDAVSADEPPTRNAWNFPVFNNWSPKRIFADPKVVELCYAIADQDDALVERLVKNEGVDINAKGFMDITPLLWAFPLGRLESVHRWSSQGLSPVDDASRAKVREIEHEILSKHASFLEKLLKLGADPNVITQEADRRDILGDDKLVSVPGALFPPVKGYSVTHLATQRFGPAEFSYLPIVMANGGDPNLSDETRDTTPTAMVCRGDYGILGSPKSYPPDLALMIEAQADLNCRTRDGNTPILLAASTSRYSMVYMLLHAGADPLAKNDKGEDVAWYVCARQRTVKNARDPYRLDVAKLLQQVLPESTHGDRKREIGELIEKLGDVAHAERDPFVDEWAAKRRTMPQSSGADEQTQKGRTGR